MKYGISSIDSISQNFTMTNVVAIGNIFVPHRIGDGEEKKYIFPSRLTRAYQNQSFWNYIYPNHRENFGFFHATKIPHMAIKLAYHFIYYEEGDTKNGDSMFVAAIGNKFN